MKKRVLFIMPSVRSGGAEKVMLTLLRHIDKENYDIHLMVLSKEGEYINDIPADITVYDLGVRRVRKMLIPALKLIRHIQPETILSTLGHLNLALILMKPILPKGIRLIVREGSIVSQNLKMTKYSRLWFWLYRTFYKYADLIVCQSQYMLEDLHRVCNVPSKKMKVIYNPVDIERIHQKALSEKNPFMEGYINILAIGRLSKEKGYERLISSMPKLINKNPNVKLSILGLGNLHFELKKQVNQLGIHKYVNFIGFHENPYVWLKNADLFVLTSYYEGLPNALLEAITLECPVLVVDHPGGTNEIMSITGQENRVIEELVWQEEWFQRPQLSCFIKLKETFSLNRILKQYQEIL